MFKEMDAAKRDIIFLVNEFTNLGKMLQQTLWGNLNEDSECILACAV